MKEHKVCRVCGSLKLKLYLDLGVMPLSNNLLNHPDDPTPLYPLQVLFCENCGLSQLSVVIDPEKLFGHYVYRSSISQGYKDHCKKMAIDLKQQFNLDESSFHIDIAGNDGALLEEFKKVINGWVLNIDPAQNLTKICEAKDIRMYNAFWGFDAVKHLKNTNWPEADLITATNVFAHVDDAEEFLLAAKQILKPNGHLVLEFPYLIDFIQKNEFDTVYFEHLSYFSINSLDNLCYIAGLKLIDVSHHNIHGGSVRCTISNLNQSVSNKSVRMYVNNEKHSGYTSYIKYYLWAIDIKNLIETFASNINRLAHKATIWGFAASAKGNVLLNCADINNSTMPYIVDQTPEKIGKYSPGVGIKIVDMPQLIIEQPDYLVLLSWNFGTEIIEKCRKAGYRGHFIYPLTWEIV